MHLPEQITYVPTVPPHKPMASILLAVCPNSLAKDDPKCHNGGRLHANNSTMEGAEYYANCAYCDCPDGWGGADCSRASLAVSA